MTFRKSSITQEGMEATGSFSGSFEGQVTLTEMMVGTASFADTASVALSATSSSYATTSSFAATTPPVVSASFATTASAATSITFVPATASFAPSSSLAVSASFATSASFAVSASHAIEAFIASNVSSSAVYIPYISGATYNDLEDFRGTIHSAGLVRGGELTLSGSIVNVGSGSGCIRVSSDAFSQLVNFDFAATQSQSVPTADTRYYVFVDYNAGAPNIQLSATRPNHLSQFSLGWVIKETVVAPAGFRIHIDQVPWLISDLAHHINERFQDVEGWSWESGAAPSVSASLTFALTAAEYYYGVDRFDTPSFNTALSSSFVYYIGTTGAWHSSGSQTKLNNQFYNNGTTASAALSQATRRAVNWIYLDPTDGDVTVLWGEGDYTTAQAIASTPPSIKPPSVQSFNSVLIARVIYQRNATTPDQIDIYTSSPAAAGAGITNHNDLSGLQGGAVGDYYHLTAAQSASINISASFATTSSFAKSGSLAVSSSFATTASYAVTASAARTFVIGSDPSASSDILRTELNKGILLAPGTDYVKIIGDSGQADRGGLMLANTTAAARFLKQVATFTGEPGTSARFRMGFVSASDIESFLGPGAALEVRPENTLFVSAVTASGGFTGSLQGTATSASYAIQAAAATDATASILAPATGRWHIDANGQSRFYFANSARTYFGSADGYMWRSLLDTDLLTLTDAGDLIIGTDPGGTALLRASGRICLSVTGSGPALPNSAMIAMLGNSDIYDAFYLEDGAAGGRGAWSIGIGTGDGLDGIGFYSRASSSVRFRIRSSGQVDVPVGPFVVGTDPGGTSLLRVGGGVKIAGDLGMTSYNWRVGPETDPNWGFAVSSSAGANQYWTELRYAAAPGEDRRGGIFDLAANRWAGYGDNFGLWIVPSGSVIGTDPGGSRALRVGGSIQVGIAQDVDWHLSTFGDGYSAKWYGKDDGAGDTSFRLAVRANAVDYTDILRVNASTGAPANNLIEIMSSSAGLALAPTKPLYLDGGGDTYIIESAGNQLDTVVGGSTKIRLTTATTTFYSADVILSGGPLTLASGDPRIYHHRTDAAADEGWWDTLFGVDNVTFRGVNDANNNAYIWLQANRDGMNISQVRLNAGGYNIFDLYGTYNYIKANIALLFQTADKTRLTIDANGGVVSSGSSNLRLEGTWDNSVGGSGAGLELGQYNGYGWIQPYDRTALDWLPLMLRAKNAYFHDGSTYSASLASTVVSASAPGTQDYPDGTIWCDTDITAIVAISASYAATASCASPNLNFGAATGSIVTAGRVRVNDGSTNTSELASVIITGSAPTTQDYPHGTIWCKV